MEQLTKCLNEQFDAKKPSSHLVQALFDRFRPWRIGQNQEGIEQEPEMDIVDFLLGCNLLSRVTQDKKIKLMF